MRYNLRNKTVVLTGASSGIGKEIATLLIKKHNCKIFAIARRETLLYELQNQLGENFIPYPFDVSIKEKWRDFATFLEKNDIQIDALINCAGILPKFSSAEKSTSEQTEMVMAVNFFSQIYATETLLPNIKKSSKGAIISFSSSSALCPFAGVSSYCASKSASRAYFECLARENKKIYVSTVMNGFVKTDIMRNQSASEKESRLVSWVSASAPRTARKIIRKIKRGKTRIIVGKDAHLMNFMYKLFPTSAPKIISWFLRKTGLELFKDI